MKLNKKDDKVGKSDPPCLTEKALEKTRPEDGHTSGPFKLKENKSKKIRGRRLGPNGITYFT